MGNRKKPRNRLLIARRALEQAGEVASLEVVRPPDEEKVLLKEVPAVVDDVVVGRTLIYDDRSVDVIYNDDIDPEAKAKIDEVTEQYKKMLARFN